MFASIALALSLSISPSHAAPTTATPAYVPTQGSTSPSLSGRVPDPISAEVALERYRIEIADTAYVTAWQSAPEEGQADGRVRLRWVGLAEGEVKLDLDRAFASRVCSVTRRDAAPQPRGDVRVYHTSPGQRASVASQPALVLVENNPDVGALVAMTPGDAVTQVSVTFMGAPTRELLRMERASGTLELSSSTKEDRACYVMKKGSES